MAKLNLKRKIKQCTYVVYKILCYSLFTADMLLYHIDRNYMVIVIQIHSCKFIIKYKIYVWQTGLQYLTLNDYVYKIFYAEFIVEIWKSCLNTLKIRPNVADAIFKSIERLRLRNRTGILEFILSNIILGISKYRRDSKAVLGSFLLLPWAGLNQNLCELVQ